MKNYNSLIDKLNVFIKNYYFEKIIKGLVLVILIFLIIYLVISSIEYNLYLNTTIRTALFWISIILMSILSFILIFRPIYEFLSQKKRLAYIDVSKIIGSHFKEIDDKLLNILQLKQLSEIENNELILASIEQKIKALKIVKFTNAINWSSLIKFAKYLSITLFTIILIILFKPNILKESTERLLNYDKYYEPKAPFDFLVLNKNLTVIEYNDFMVVADIKGEKLPTNISILYSNKEIQMSKNNKGQYTHTLKYVKKGTTFRLLGAGYRSQEYKLNVKSKPFISNFELVIAPPSYTGKKMYTQKNIADLSIPNGSIVTWKFYTQSIDKLMLRFDNSTFEASKFLDGFGLKKALVKEGQYNIIVYNLESKYKDSFTYNISIQNDASPNIVAIEFKDSINSLNYYAIDISDDYGISSLFMIAKYSIGNKLVTNKWKLQTSNKLNQTIEVEAAKYLSKMPKGAKVEYYFEVFDNDIVSGPKSSVSQLFKTNILTDNQQIKAIDQKATSLKSDLSDLINESKELQKQFDLFKKKLLDKSKIDFEDKKQFEKILQLQKELEDKIKNTQNELEKNFENKNKFSNQEKDILEKQNQLNELLDQINNPEKNKLLDQINELMNKLDKKEILNNLQKMDNSTKKVEKDLDRMLNLYKNLDKEQKINDAIDKLEELANKQEKLSNESNQNNNDKQKELKEQTKNLKEDLKAIEKLNKELKGSEQQSLEEIEKDIESALDDQEESMDDKKTNNKNEKSQKQKNAAKKLKKAADKLKKTKKKQKKNSNMEDAASIRRLLQNLIYLSFEEEKIIENSKVTSTHSANYSKITQEQKKIFNDFGLVEDTLYKLASRQFKIKKKIFEEITNINSHSQLSIASLVARNTNNAIVHQQYTMTSFNNLSLMLSESLRQMNEENEEENDSDSDKQCDNPKKKGKKGKPNPSKLSELQQQLNQQMQQLQKSMSEKKGQQNDNSMSKEFAKIAAQQAAIRQALSQLEKEGNNPDKKGKKPLGNLNDIMQKMDNSEKDFLNKKISAETIARQKQIEIKLLEAANAAREQDQDDKRESQKPSFISPIPPSELKKYLEDKKNSENFSQKNAIGLKPFYKSLVDKYFQKLK